MYQVIKYAIYSYRVLLLLIFWFSLATFVVAFCGAECRKRPILPSVQVPADWAPALHGPETETSHAVHVNFAGIWSINLRRKDMSRSDLLGNISRKI